MNTLKMLLLPLICLLSTATFAQDRNQVLCKGSPVPEGYAISGEMISDSCNGTAWIIKPKAGPRSRLDRFNSAASNTVSPDRKSTRLNSSHLVISYAVFCLKKKKN